MIYKDYEDASEILQLRRDIFKDEQIFESILKFLDLNKYNDLMTQWLSLCNATYCILY